MVTTSQGIIHWSVTNVSECGKFRVRSGEGGSSNIDQVTCDACLEISLRTDPPKSTEERKRIAKQLARVMKAHGISVIGDAVIVEERQNMAAKKQEPGTHDVKIEKFQRNLRVVLKNDEIVERAKRGAFLLGEIQQKEGERDAAKKQANAHIEELSSELHRLSLEVRDGAAYRDVACERRFLYRTGAVVEVRTDTKEQLHERVMTEPEKQLDLGLKAPTGKKGAAAEAKAISDTVAKDETDAATPSPAPEKKRRGRKPKAE